MFKTKKSLDYTIFYDTETNGLPKNNGLTFPAIMQIVIFDADCNKLLSLYVQPFDGNIDGTHIHRIDADKLFKNNAVTMREACEQIKMVLYNNYGRSKINWVAYNNFGFDQAVLEANFRASGIKIPNNWVFIDLYPIVKELYPNMKPNYKLKTVYQILTGLTDEDLENMSFHNAEIDVMCLYTIGAMMRSEFGDTIYNNLLAKYTRPLLSDYSILDSHISVLNGYSEKNCNGNFNIYVRDLMKIYKDCGYNIDIFDRELKKTSGLIYTKMIAQNINTIKYSLNLK